MPTMPRPAGGITIILSLGGSRSSVTGYAGRLRMKLDNTTGVAQKDVRVKVALPKALRAKGTAAAHVAHIRAGGTVRTSIPVRVNAKAHGTFHVKVTITVGGQSTTKTETLRV